MEVVWRLIWIVCVYGMLNQQPVYAHTPVDEEPVTQHQQLVISDTGSQSRIDSLNIVYKPQPWEALGGYLLIIAGIIFLVFIVVLLWNTSLRREVSRRRRTEIALRESEQSLLQSQRIAAIGSWQLSVTDRVMSCSDEMHQILGVAPEALDNCYKQFLDTIHEDDRLRVENYFYTTVQYQNDLDCQFRIMGADGGIRYVKCQGKVSAETVHGTLQDITDRHLSDLFFQGFARQVTGNHGTDYFIALAGLLAETFNVAYVMVGVINQSDPGRVDSLCLIAKGKVVKDFYYQMADTPCQKVLENHVCFYARELRLRFPDVAVLQQMEADSYAGIPMFNSEGKCNGLIVMLDQKPMLHEQATLSILQVAASRASSELQELEAERQLKLTSLVFENTQEGIIIADAAGCIIRVNRAFSEMSGFTEADVLERRPEFLYSRAHHDHHFVFHLRQVLNKKGRWQGELWNQRKDGSVFPALQSIERISDSGGKVQHYISVFTDITEKKADEEKIQYLAHFDAITGLPNRVLFNDRLHKAIQRARRFKRQVGLMFLDLDRFKYINDTLGHPVGDMLLERVGMRLQKSIRQLDTVARLGGDEFVVIVEDLDKVDTLNLLAEKIMQTLSQPVQLESHRVSVHSSIGMSLFPMHGDNAEQLVKHADMAMYHAKESGRNQAVLYVPELSVRTYESYSLERSLRHAIDTTQLRLHYQPQVRLSDGRLATVEALVRWQKDDGYLVEPDQFIPQAEENGLIIPLGKWVLQQACRQMKCWLDQGLNIRVAVNISGLQIINGNWLGTVKEVLEETGLPACNLELEITESYVIQHIDQVAEVLAKLRALGIRISIDDFGTGYSSLSYLKLLPVDALKIDRSFLQDVPNSHSDGKIIAAIIAMAAQLGLDVVAEGVENAAQLSFLSQRDCDLVQGYLIASPQSVSELDEWLVRHYRHESTTVRRSLVE
ncbi:bifunctional diguanylate cyclase/phosphodiesterase [Aliamphritea ceti]|uniref:bifunctional diguanylate cyclase/phosphodiesterase n=1 Tax=Aliamphritea ceti TaxID=1524258 RepID=UPI0021C3D5F2|nr:GGDEF domain-containing phosphodiesterase [Aliamphritea ceti]